MAIQKCSLISGFFQMDHCGTERTAPVIQPKKPRSRGDEEKNLPFLLKAQATTTTTYTV
jgi:hypothetical protein